MAETSRITYYRVDSGIEGASAGVVRKVEGDTTGPRYQVMDPFTKEWIDSDCSSRVDRPDFLDAAIISESEALSILEERVGC